MRANYVPFNAVGNGGIFQLLAERLSSSPARREARPADAFARRPDAAVARLMAENEARDTVLVRRSMYTRYAPGLSSPEGRAIAVSGMWARVGFVGASLLATGLVLLSNHSVGALSSLALVLGGGALATYGWRNAWKVLDRIDGASVGTSGATDRSDARQALDQC